MCTSDVVLSKSFEKHLSKLRFCDGDSRAIPSDFASESGRQVGEESVVVVRRVPSPDFRVVARDLASHVLWKVTRFHPPDRQKGKGCAIRISLH